MTTSTAQTHGPTAPVEKPQEKSVLLRIENTYSDGHESASNHRIAPPANPSEKGLDEWWNDEVFALTGDGHGADHPGLKSSHYATVMEGPAALVCATYEWG